MTSSSLCVPTEVSPEVSVGGRKMLILCVNMSSVGGRKTSVFTANISIFHMRYRE
jgi:hypothetical protein